MHRHLALVAVVALAGCGGGISVNQDFAPGTDFTPYRTYAWMPNQRASSDALTDQRIRMAVEDQLAARGYRQASAAPDFYVGYQLVLSQQVDYQTVNDYWGTGWNYGGVYGPTLGPTSSTSRTTAVTYTIGTLVIDFFNAESHNLIWRGSAEGEINEARSPQERQERANEAVSAILDQFPPETSE